MTTARVVLLGAGGMLGRDLIAAAPATAMVAAYPRAALDVADATAIAAALDRHRPDWVLNASAWTRVDDAEMEERAAHAINGEAPGVLGALCAARGIAVLHVSTDYVFDGVGLEAAGPDGRPARRPWREDDPVAPLNAYGRGKLAGERALAASAAAHVVVRTQWLYGTHGRSFPRTMLARARAGTPVRVVDDQHGAPTHTGDLAQALWALVAQDARGVVHVANAGQATWYDVARATYAAAGADPALVAPCPSTAHPTPARRPAWGVLDLARLRERHGVTMRPWEEALADFCRAALAEPA